MDVAERLKFQMGNIELPIECINKNNWTVTQIAINLKIKTNQIEPVGRPI